MVSLKLEEEKVRNSLNQQDILLEALARSLRKAEYWIETIAKAKDQKQIELWNRLKEEAYSQIENNLYLLSWLEEKETRNLEELNTSGIAISVEPKNTRQTVPQGFHRSFGSILIKDRSKEK